MGLDQNLYTRNGKELIYWRKVNCLHKYFTECALNRDEVDDDNCVDFIIDRVDLEELRDIAVALLRAYTAWSFNAGADCWALTYKDTQYEDPFEMAEALLPTQSGFFFGSYDYDDLYFSDLINIVKQVSEVLGEYGDSEFIYSAWY